MAELGAARGGRDAATSAALRRSGVREFRSVLEEARVDVAPSAPLGGGVDPFRGATPFRMPFAELGRSTAGASRDGVVIGGTSASSVLEIRSSTLRRALDVGSESRDNPVSRRAPFTRPAGPGVMDEARPTEAGAALVRPTLAELVARSLAVPLAPRAPFAGLFAGPFVEGFAPTELGGGVLVWFSTGRGLGETSSATARVYQRGRDGATRKAL